MHTVATIDVKGDKIRVLPKDYQLDPVKDFPTHVDFLRVSANSTIKVEIPVHFINQDISVGLKRGGILNIVRHEVEFHCPVDAIPDAIEVDLAKVDIGQSVQHFRCQAAGRPEATIDRDFTVATIVSPAAHSKKQPGCLITGKGCHAAQEQVLAIPAENMRTTGTISVSWRRT